MKTNFFKYLTGIAFTILLLFVSMLTTNIFDILPIQAAPGDMEMIAGTGTEEGRFILHNVPAGESKFIQPSGFAVDNEDNLYFSEVSVNQIIKIDAKTNILNPIAGTGSIALKGWRMDDQFYGDGGDAITTALTEPSDLVFDKDGNLYFIDRSTIRKIKNSGIIITLFGSNETERTELIEDKEYGFFGPSNLSVDDKGNLYTAYGIGVYKINTNGGEPTKVAGSGGEGGGTCGDGGSATSARFKYITDIAVDSKGNLYIADPTIDRICMVDTQTGTSTTLISINEALDPTALAFDREDNLYYSHSQGISMIDSQTGTIVDISQSAAPDDMTFDSVGNLYFYAHSTVWGQEKGYIYRLEKITEVAIEKEVLPTQPTTTFTTETVSFSDVPTNHLNNDAIKYVKDKGYVQGYEDGSYRPDIPINRAEFLKIVIEAKFPGQAGGSNCFTDVSNEWFASYACFAKSKGIVRGYPDGSFIGWSNISFVEAAKIILFAYGIELDPSDPWFKNIVEEMARKGAIPTSITKFSQEITRGEMAEIIQRLLEKITTRPSMSYSQLGF